MNKGSRLCTISDDTSISKLTKPSTQTPRGTADRGVVEELDAPDGNWGPDMDEGGREGRAKKKGQPQTVGLG
jgi:hypothetical protein